MRERLDKAKRKDGCGWVYGNYVATNLLDGNIKHEIYGDEYIDEIDLETLSQYTGCSEFTMANGYGEKLFENDIVETWKERSVYGVKQSQHDGWVKARGVIRFKEGAFYIDFDNEYNRNIFKAKGLEEYDRDFNPIKYLPHFHWIKPENLQWQQEHNSHMKNHDIVKLGNVFDNMELIGKMIKINSEPNNC